MAIVKKNLYTIGDNSTITNLVENTPVFNLDKTFITYSAPNILVKVGSQIECNGNLYVVETSDVSITAANGNLTFNSNTLTFAISASAYTYNNLKRGDYIDANTRVCRWRMNSSGQYAIRQDSNFAIRPKRKILSWGASSDTYSNNITNYNSFFDDIYDLVGNKYATLRATGFIYSSRGAFTHFNFFICSKIIFDSLNNGYNVFGLDRKYIPAPETTNFGFPTLKTDGYFSGSIAVELP